MAEKNKFKGVDTLMISPSGKATEYFPTKLPWMSAHQWSKFRKGNYKDIKIKVKGGGTRLLTNNEIMLLKSVPYVKENESTKSFQTRVSQWEGITGIKIHEGKGMGFKSDSARVKAGEPRLFGLNVPQDIANTPDWKDTLNDLNNAYNYANVLNNQRTVDPLPINQKEIDREAIDDATLIFKKNNPGQKVSKVTPTNQGNGLEITSNNGNTQVVRGTQINNKTNDNKLVKQAAISNPEWKDIEWAEEIATKNKIKNAKAFMERAKDIERAYGSLVWVAKQKYINSPITQLEMEA